MKKMQNKLALFTLVAGVALVPMTSVAKGPKLENCLKYTLSTTKMRKCLANNQLKQIVYWKAYCKSLEKGKRLNCRIWRVYPHQLKYNILQTSGDTQPTE